MHDLIIIEDLELQCHIGISDEERSAPQRLTVSMTLQPSRDFSNLRDDIRNAVDYHRVVDFVKRMAEARPRRLIETLGTELAEDILAHFPIQLVDLHLRKYIVPGVGAVGIRLRREKSSQSPRRAG